MTVDQCLNYYKALAELLEAATDFAKYDDFSVPVWGRENCALENPVGYNIARLRFHQALQEWEKARKIGSS